MSKSPLRRLAQLATEARKAWERADTMRGLPNDIAYAKGYAAGLDRAGEIMNGETQ